jgi:ABC-type uncharacterized transport system auxiliary subunit
MTTLATGASPAPSDRASRLIARGDYSDARWVEPAPQMVRDLIVSAFENADWLNA